MTEFTIRPWADKIPFDGHGVEKESSAYAGLQSHEIDQPVEWFKCHDSEAAHSVWNDEDWLAYRLLEANLMLPDCIEIDPRKRGGIPVIKGTRFTAAQVLAEIADGRSVVQLCETFELDAESVTRFLHVLSIYLDRPAPSVAYARFPTR